MRTNQDSLVLENSKILRSIWKNTFDKILEIKVSNKRGMTELKSKIMVEEMKKIDEKLNKEYKREFDSNKIEISKLKNQTSLEKMQKKNEFIETIVKETLDKLKDFAKSSNDRYKQLLKDLLIECMVKMLEPTLLVQVRKEDVEYVESIFDECEKEFEEFMLKETKREYKCKLVIDDVQNIEEDYGGIRVLSKDRKIILSNDLKSRLYLSRDLQLPTIKNILFPKEMMGNQ